VSRSRTALSLGVTFIFAGTMHFLRPREYEAIMPPYVPAHKEMVAISGAGEIIGGLAALSPRAHGFCRLWLITLLIAVFPANVHWAMHPDEVKGLPDVPRWMLWARLPFQGAFIAWVIAATRRD
jgi:uncharacterized membrane protein